MATLRERVVSINSLVCLLKAMQGWRTTIELRNENSVTGDVITVDFHMNTRMENCVFQKLDGSREQFDDFFVLGKNIRFVHIPDRMDIMRAVQAQVNAFNREMKRNRQPKRTDKKKRGLYEQLARQETSDATETLNTNDGTKTGAATDEQKLQTSKS